ncbi:hypothetical protein Btru_028257 [Bulinus truncatus]|nr:hypothetical protein Btru_028257 [Bulinus truncatus]
MSCSSSCDCLDDERSSLLSVVSRDEGASTCGSCPVCQQLDRKRHELRKHHQAVMKKLMSHRRTSHPELVVADSMSSSPKAKSENHLEHHGNPSRPKGLAVAAAAATNNVSGGLADSRCHFPFMQIVRTPVNPPRPRVRRLIGEQAKMIGRKIDSSNLQFALMADEEKSIIYHGDLLSRYLENDLLIFSNQVEGGERGGSTAFIQSTPICFAEESRSQEDSGRDSDWDAPNTMTKKIGDSDTRKWRQQNLHE